jgi:hypothetical protein
MFRVTPKKEDNRSWLRQWLCVLFQLRKRPADCVEAVIRVETEELSEEYMQKLLEVRELAYRLHYLSTRQVQRDTRNMPPSPRE